MCAIKMTFAADTHIGQWRPHNEDALLVYPEKHLFAVADGMGGHGHGDLASKLAVDAIRDWFVGSNTPRPNPSGAQKADQRTARRLVVAVQQAHKRIFQAIAAQPHLDGMGTTIVVLHLVGSRAYVAHVGDSRCYVLREGSLHQLTKDHSMVSDLQEKMQLGAVQKQRLSAYEHVVSRALGTGGSKSIEVDLKVFPYRPGDLFLLCTDGLTGELEDAEIKRIVLEQGTASAALAALIDEANRRGGRDNVSVALVKLH